MAFDDKSRYRNAPKYEVVDARGRTVRVVAVPEPLRQRHAGVHARKQGQRLDHLAFKYLDDAAGYWRIAEHEDALTAEQLSEVLEVRIPTKVP